MSTTPNSGIMIHQLIKSEQVAAPTVENFSMPELSQEEMETLLISQKQYWRENLLWGSETIAYALAGVDDDLDWD